MQVEFLYPMRKMLSVPDGNVDLGFICPARLKNPGMAKDENGESMVDVIDKSKDGIVISCKKAGNSVTVQLGGSTIEYACGYCKGLISVKD